MILLSILGLLLAVLDYFEFGRRFNKAATNFFNKGLIEAVDILTLGRTKLNPPKHFRNLNIAIFLSIFIIALAGMVHQATLPVGYRSQGFRDLTWYQIPLLLLLWPAIGVLIIYIQQMLTLGISGALFSFGDMSSEGKAIFILTTPIWLIYLVISAPYALASSALFGVLTGIGYLLSLPPKGILATTGLLVAVVAALYR